MSNTSATGGYLTPSSNEGTGPLTLTQFLQKMIAGISGYNGTLVRPAWQIEDPKQPDILVNWIAFGITQNTPDANAWTGYDAAGNFSLQRQESLEIQCSFYGPNAFDNIGIFRDGFQLQQNLESLRAADMGFTEIGPAIRGPDLVNERWVERYVVVLTLVRRVVRGYSVLSFASASGTIHTDFNSQDKIIPWDATKGP